MVQRSKTTAFLRVFVPVLIGLGSPVAQGHPAIVSALPAQNVDGGVRFLKDLLELFDGDIALTIAAYNAGAGAVIRAGYSIPSKPETLAFVPRVLWYYQVSQSVARAREAPVDEPTWTVATHDAVPRMPLGELAGDHFLDRGLPPPAPRSAASGPAPRSAASGPEREKRPTGIVSARRSSRWRLGRVRFSGAASTLPPLTDARDAKRSRGAGKVRSQSRNHAGIPAARPAASTRKVSR